MRVTQMMLTNSNLSYLSKNYQRLGNLQDQLITNKKITKPSDDPVVAMKGMRYRSQVVEVEQFQRNLNEVYSWMDNADAAFEETTQALQRIRELTVEASNDSNSPKERENIAKEIRRLNEHIVSVANTRFNGKYIFNGSDTSSPPVNTDYLDLDINKIKTATPLAELEKYSITFKGEVYEYDSGAVTAGPWTFKKPGSPAGTDTITITETAPNAFDIANAYTYKDELTGADINATRSLKESDFMVFHQDAISTNDQTIEMEVLTGVYMPVNANSQKVFSNEMFGGINELAKKLEDPTTESGVIDDYLDVLDNLINGVISERSEIGARTNRVEMIENRLMQQELTAKGQMSQNEDIDFEKVVIDLKIQESIHRASLAAGARIIQPTLMDFLR